MTTIKDDLQRSGAGRRYGGRWREFLASDGVGSFYSLVVGQIECGQDRMAMINGAGRSTQI